MLIWGKAERKRSLLGREYRNLPAERDLQSCDDGYIFEEGGGVADGISVIRSGRGMAPPAFVKRTLKQGGIFHGQR